MSLCDNCSFYCQLTKKEKRVVVNILGPRGFSIFDCKGICIGSRETPNYLIQRIIINGAKECESFIAGTHTESLHIPCPVCNSGNLIINRQKEVNLPVKLKISCSNFPDCGYIADEVELKTICRFCHNNLILKVSDILSVECPYCKKPPVKLPISPGIYPALIFPKGQCAHTLKFTECAACNKSRLTRKNLLVVERSWLQFLLIEPDKKPSEKKYLYDLENERIHNPSNYTRTYHPAPPDFVNRGGGTTLYISGSGRVYSNAKDALEE